MSTHYKLHQHFQRTEIGLLASALASSPSQQRTSRLSSLSSREGGQRRAAAVPVRSWTSPPGSGASGGAAVAAQAAIFSGGGGGGSGGGPGAAERRRRWLQRSSNINFSGAPEPRVNARPAQQQQPGWTLLSSVPERAGRPTDQPGSLPATVPLSFSEGARSGQRQHSGSRQGAAAVNTSTVIDGSLSGLPGRISSQARVVRPASSSVSDLVWTIRLPPVTQNGELDVDESP